MTDSDKKETDTVEQVKEASSVYEESQWVLMHRRYSKHKLALWMFYVIIFLYVICIACPFVGSNAPSKIHSEFINLPPQPVKFGMVEGYSVPRFYQNEVFSDRDAITLEKNYMMNTEKRNAIEFFVEGAEWYALGLIKTNIHLMGFNANSNNKLFLLGTDSLGQDLFSRILYGGRISMFVGLCGVALSFVLGVSLGGISGYFGGVIDIVIQRTAEILQSIPAIPIWMALAAAIPKDWSSLQSYFAMTVILAGIAWTGLARVVRGKLLSLREEDYAKAATLCGASEMRVIFKHLIPNFFSHIVASLSLAIPRMILAETSLSFLGLGIRPPMVSWGTLLEQANNVEVVMNQPWLLLPGAMVVIAVLGFNFIGEGMRDAADPYAN